MHFNHFLRRDPLDIHNTHSYLHNSLKSCDMVNSGLK